MMKKLIAAIGALCVVLVLGGGGLLSSAVPADAPITAPRVKDGVFCAAAHAGDAFLRNEDRLCFAFWMQDGRLRASILGDRPEPFLPQSEPVELAQLGRGVVVLQYKRPAATGGADVYQFDLAVMRAHSVLLFRLPPPTEGDVERAAALGLTLTPTHGGKGVHIAAGSPDAVRRWIDEIAGGWLDRLLRDSDRIRSEMANAPIYIRRGAATRSEEATAAAIEEVKEAFFRAMALE